MKTKKHCSRILIVLALMSLGQLALAQVLPADAQPTCTVPAPTFATWFVSGSVTPNGSVNPANSVMFAPNSNCSFYQWSEQMFLWVNSPAPPTYGGGGGRVFDSPVFFDISDLSASNTRTFIPHTAGFRRSLLLRSAQLGPNGTPVAIVSGKLTPVVRLQTGPSGKSLINTKAG